MTVWRMRIACLIPKATRTYSEYVILIAFPQQQMLHEGTFVLRSQYNACIVVVCIGLDQTFVPRTITQHNSPS